MKGLSRGDCGERAEFGPRTNDVIRWGVETA